MKTLAAWLCTILCAALFGASAHAQPVQVVLLGHVGPMSGPQAHHGKDTQNAARMAVDDLNARQLVIGGSRIEFKLMAEDDAADPRQGTAAAQKLCDARVAGVVGHINSGSAIPASGVYEACGVPFISAGSTNPKLTQLGHKNTFRILANDSALAAGVALYSARTLKLTRVALVDDRTGYGEGVASVFKASARSLGIDIAAEAFTTDKASDFSVLLTSIKAKKVQALFYGGADAQAGPMLRQMDQLGMTHVRMLGGDGICSTQMGALSLKAKSLANVVCAEGGASLARMPGGAQWKRRYDARFPGEYVLFSPYTYDGYMVLADAMQRADSTDPAVYRSKLFETDFKGVTTQVQFDATGELKNPAITLYTFKDGIKTPL